MLLYFLAMLTADFKPLEKINLSRFDIYATNVICAVGEDETVAMVLDGREKVMLLIDQKGGLIARCGGKGQGPQEFQSPDAVWWDQAHKAFAVYDSDNNRVSRWDGEGRFLDAVPSKHRLKRPRQAGKTLFYTRNEKATQESPPAIMIMNGQTTPQPFWEIPDPDYKPPQIKVSGYTMFVAADWNPTILYDLGRDFVAVAYTNRDWVEIYDMNGRRTGKMTPDFKEYEVTDGDVDRLIDHTFAMARESLRSQREALFHGKTWPKIRGLLVDRQDRIWMVGQPESKTYPIQIYDRAGKLIRKTQLPFQPSFISGDMVYGLSENEDDIYLERRTIRF